MLSADNTVALSYPSQLACSLFRYLLSRMARRTSSAFVASIALEDYSPSAGQSLLYSPYKKLASRTRGVAALLSARSRLASCFSLYLAYSKHGLHIRHQRTPFSQSASFAILRWRSYYCKEADQPSQKLSNLARSQFLLGMPFYVIFVQLPQRFQAVNFTTAERAGILLLPATLMTPVGSMAAGLAATKVPLEIILISSVCIVCLGVGLLGSLPTQSALSAKTYAYEIVAGLGLGSASPPYFMLIAASVAEKDMSVGTGALSELFHKHDMCNTC
jgi:hypothetical protein